MPGSHSVERGGRTEGMEGSFSRDGGYTAAEERRRIERGPDLHASRRTQRRVAEMRLGYKL